MLVDRPASTAEVDLPGDGEIVVESSSRRTLSDGVVIVVETGRDRTADPDVRVTEAEFISVVDLYN